MAKVIKMDLSVSSIDNAIKELKAFRDSLEIKKLSLLKGLGEIGVYEASLRFTTAIYDGVNDSDVSLEATAQGYAIVARGQAVAFIEFGSGVYHNPGEPYPGPRPDGVVGIGEYGKGHGARTDDDGNPIPWVYKGQPGSNGLVLKNGAVMTRGNPAAMPMWYASEEMRSKILKIAKEVFGT